MVPGSNKDDSLQLRKDEKGKYMQRPPKGGRSGNEWVGNIRGERLQTQSMNGVPKNGNLIIVNCAVALWIIPQEKYGEMHGNIPSGLEVAVRPRNQQSEGLHTICPNQNRRSDAC